MRIFLNAWLRQWAEASLRQELHQANDKLIRSQEIRERLINQSQEQTKANKKKMDCLKAANKRGRAYDEALIKAVRERMSDEMFQGIVAYVRAIEELKA